MTLTIDLPADLEADLVAQARTHGRTAPIRGAPAPRTGSCAGGICPFTVRPRRRMA